MKSTETLQKSVFLDKADVFWQCRHMIFRLDLPYAFPINIIITLNQAGDVSIVLQVAGVHSRAEQVLIASPPPQPHGAGAERAQHRDLHLQTALVERR